MVFVPPAEVLIDYFQTEEKDIADSMNIDLFLTPHGEAGLLCDHSFKNTVVGIILDAQTRDITLEFADGGEPFHLNIPVDMTHHEKLLFAHRMHVAFLEEGLLAGSVEVPLLYLNDPYGSEFGQGSPLSKPKKSLTAFEEFMKRCAFAQSLHRDNLGDEDSARSVLRGMDPYHMAYTPAMMRERQLVVMPSMGSSHGPSGPALGSAGTRTAARRSSEDQSE